MGATQAWVCILQEAGTLPEQLQVFPWFSQRVLARCSDNSITHHDLLKLLSADRCVPLFHACRYSYKLDTCCLCLVSVA